MDAERNNTLRDARFFLKGHNTGVLATVSATGEPHASTVYYTADDDFNVYILTLISSRTGGCFHQTRNSVMWYD